MRVRIPPVAQEISSDGQLVGNERIVVEAHDPREAAQRRRHRRTLGRRSGHVDHELATPRPHHDDLRLLEPVISFAVDLSGR